MVQINQLVSEVVIKDAASQVADRVASAMDRMAAAERAAGTATEDVDQRLARSTRSLENAARSFERLKMQVDPLYRSQVELANVQTRLQRAVDLGVTSQREAQAVLAQYRAETERTAVSTSTFGDVLRQARTYLAAFGVTIGVASIVRFGLDSLEAAGNLGEMAEQIGITTTALQAYQFAATQSGISQEELTTSLSRFSRTIGDAATGNKAAIDSFNKLGVGILDSNGKLRTSQAILLDVAKAINSIQDPALKAAAAVDFFGRSGQKLLPMFAGGAEGLQAFIDRARELGLVLDEVAIRRADMANDKIQEMRFRFEKLGQSIAVLLIPNLNAVIEKLDRIIRQGPTVGDALDAILRHPFLGGPFGAAADYLLRQFDNETAAPSGGTTTRRLSGPDVLGSVPNQPAPAGNTTNPPNQGEVDKVQAVIDQLRLEQDQLHRTATEQAIYNNLKKAGVDLSSAAGKTIAAETIELHKLTLEQKVLADQRARDAAIAAQMDADRIAAMRRGHEMVDEQIRQTAERDRQQTKSLEQIALETRLIGASNEQRAVAIARLEAMNELHKKEGDILDKNEQRYVDQAEAIARASTRLDQQRASYEELSNFATRAFDRIGEAITQAFATGSIKAVDFLNIGRAVISELTQEFISLGAINPLKNWLTGSSLPTLGSVLGAGGGGFNLGGLLSGGSGFNLSSIFGGGSGLGAHSLGGSIATPSMGFSWGGAGLTAAMNLLPLAFTLLSGGKLTGSSIGGAAGGTIGGIAGSFLGPVGSVLGSLLGNLLGGLVGGIFGGGFSKPSASGYFNVADNSAILTDVTNKHGGNADTARQSVSAYADTLSALLQQTDLTIMNGRISGYIQAQQNKAGETNFYGNLAVGQAGGPASQDYYTRVPLGGPTNKGEEGLKQIVADLIRATLQKAAEIGALGGAGATATTLTVLRNTKAASIEALGADLEFAKLYDQLTGLAQPTTQFAAALKAVNQQFAEAKSKATSLGLALAPLEQAQHDAVVKLTTDFNQSISDQILSITDPLTLALNNLAKAQEERLKEAKAAGANLVEVERLSALERQRVIEQATGNLNASLAAFYQNLTYGPLSGVSPAGSLSGSRAAFMAAAAQASAGDLTAQGRLVDLGTTFLGYSRSVNASSPAYQSDLATVVSAIGPLLSTGSGSLINAVTDGNREIARLLAANNIQNQQLVDEITELRAANEALSAQVRRILSQMQAA